MVRDARGAILNPDPVTVAVTQILKAGAQFMQPREGAL